MLRNRHFISYFSTTLIYLSLAGLFFYVQEHQFVSAEKLELQTMNMTLSTFVPEVIPPVEEVEEKIIEEEIVEEEPLVEPEIIEEPIVEEEVIPEPIIEKVVPKPVIEEKPKPKVKKIVKKKVKKKKVKKKKVKKKRTKKTVSSVQSKSSPAKKNKFLAQVRAKINKHKSYPRIAKKRGMQGSIKVKFTILRNGNVGHISVNGPKVFHNSARDAVKSAFPINAKNAPISLPMSVNITLRYQIR